MCEDELICDFAETYHIFNYEELSPKTVATLCFGLREDSRVKMKLSGLKITLSQMLLARMTDELSFQSWAKTKDGQKNRNRPESVLKTLIARNEEDKVVSFMTSDDFNKAWENIVNATDNR